MSGDSPCRVLFLTLYPETMPSSRLRVYQYLPYLSHYGIDAKVLTAIPEPLFSKFYYSPSKAVRFLHYTAEFLGNLRRILESRFFDIVFVQKAILLTAVKGLDRVLEWANPRLIFDFDDLIYDRTLVEFSAPFLRGFQDPHQTEKLSSRCRAVIVGNAHLKEQALRYNRNVFLIPTPVDTERFQPKAKNSQNNHREIVIGWIGTGDGLTYVRLLEKVFQELSRRYPVRLKLITRLDKVPFEIPGVKIDLVPWSYQTEVQEMQEFDIGVMPFPDTDWVRGKCGLKLLQYMSMAIPAVSSRLGTSGEIIEEGVDGLLAYDHAEWVDKLSCLIEDAVLRKDMGQAGRNKVVEKYSLQIAAPYLAKILKESV